jgi:hypothetical protein
MPAAVAGGVAAAGSVTAENGGGTAGRVRGSAKSECDTGGDLLDLLDTDDHDESCCRDVELPYGHLYDALMACGCQAAASVRRQYLGEEFGMLAGVPEEDRTGGRGNIGLIVTVSASARVRRGLVCVRACARACVRAHVLARVRVCARTCVRACVCARAVSAL